MNAVMEFSVEEERVRIAIMDFSPDEERVRISTVFKGNTRRDLASVLDKFEDGKLGELELESATWTDEFKQYLHPAITDAILGVQFISTKS